MQSRTPCYPCDRVRTPVVEIGGKPRSIDACIVDLVKALNAAGIETIASCCGHLVRLGSIILRDGREIVVLPDYDTAREFDKLFPAVNDGPVGGVPGRLRELAASVKRQSGESGEG